MLNSNEKERNTRSQKVPDRGCTQGSSRSSICAFWLWPALHYVKCFDALSATDLRAIRYAKEIPSLTSIVANEVAASAVETNADGNGVKRIVRPHNGDCRAYLYSLVENLEADRHQAICRKVRYYRHRSARKRGPIH
jgi:tRNA G26 N,N-dimethylase Trm1